MNQPGSFRICATGCQAGKESFGLDLSGLKPGAMEARGKRFETPAVGAAAGGGNPLPREAGPVPVGADVSGIIFLHTPARGASNDMSYRTIHNFPDTAGQPGRYDVV